MKLKYDSLLMYILNRPYDSVIKHLHCLLLNAYDYKYFEV